MREKRRRKKPQQGENERQQDAEEERRQGHEGEKHVAGVKRRGSGAPLLRSPTVESLKASLTSPSAMCLSAFHSKLWLKGLARHTRTQAPTNTPLRAIHAGIGMH